MKKVLFVNFTQIYGGGEVYLENILNFRDEKTEKYLITPENKVINNLNKDIKIIKGYYKSGGLKNICNYIQYIKEIILIQKIIKEYRIEYIFFNGIEAGYIAPFIGKKVFKISIWHINFISKNFLKSFFLKLMLKSLDNFILITKSQKKTIENLIGKNYNSKLKLIYNGIDEKKFFYSEVQNKDKIKIAQISRLEKHKGIYDLIETFKDLKLKNVELLIAGEGKERENIIKKIKEYNLEKNIKLVGFIKTSTFLKEVDILVLPSYSEGLPLILLEAMSSGVPIIATKVDGIPEIIENNVNGYLFSPGDIEALKKLILDLVNDFEKRKKFSSNGRKKLLEMFTVKKMCVETYKLFERE